MRTWPPWTSRSRPRISAEIDVAASQIEVQGSRLSEGLLGLSE